MILRSFNRHVADQNWFAVCIDLLVVVVGIFLGLQVTDWGNDRQNVKWEQEFYRDLKSDLARDLEHLSTVIEFQSGKGDRLRAALQQIEGDGSSMGAVYFNARAGNTTFFPANGVYQSALTSGKIELIRNKAIRYRIINLYGHHYTRITYNGELYDRRQEATAWEARKDFDFVKQEFRRWDDDVAADIRAQFAYLSTQNVYYLDLVRNLDEELRFLISELEKQID